ncbi:MAG: triose-phosphate isomerase [Eubacteriales bacterium]|nr:triose-phosphate isomerase [Eubacteriales bacterium]
MSKLFIGTNTKMYKTIAQTKIFLQRLGEQTADLSRDEMELFVIPSYTALESAGPICRNGGIRLGAQNMNWEDEGQFTGEISPVMLKETGVEIAELGHSERRHVLGETDAEINRKVLAAFKHGLTPLLCIGETKEQKELGIADEILRIQLKAGLNGVAQVPAPFYVAYEPVWAIGVNGEPATEGYAQEKHAVIRETLVNLFGERGRSVPVLYGGSVNPENAKPLIRMPHVNGLFIGRSAWDADRFNGIIREVLPIALSKTMA